MTAPAPLDLTALLGDLERAHAAATPGPWATDERRPADVVNHKGFPVAYAVTTLDRYADAALIVAAVNAAPTLIAELRKRDAAEKLREFAEWVVSLDDDDPESPGRVHRRTVTLTEIVGRAAAALSPESVQS